MPANTNDRMLVELTVRELQELIADAVAEAVAQAKADADAELEPFLRPRECARRMGIGMARLAVLRRNGLPCLKMGTRTYRYRWSEVQTWQSRSRLRLVHSRKEA